MPWGPFASMANIQAFEAILTGNYDWFVSEKITIFELQMKHLAVILATYISLLTFQPVINKMIVLVQKSTEHCGTSCCSKGQKEKNTPTDNCDRNNCNPCQPCGNCCGYYYTDNSFHLIKILVTISYKHVVNEVAISNFSNDCFHPPERA